MSESFKRIEGIHQSYWSESVDLPEFQRLRPGLFVDVIVLGAGITGVTTAVLLQQAGYSVALLEARRVNKSVTANTTAKITALHGLIYHKLIKKFGREQAQQYADANMAAIEKIAWLIESFKIDCDFSRQIFATYTQSKDHVDEIRSEVESAQSLNLPASFQETLALPLPIEAAVQLENQARFHPIKYIRGLLEILRTKGAHIFENTMATNIKEDEPCIVETNQGELKAKHVVIATNYPFYDYKPMFFSRLYASRSYAVAVRMKETFPDGMYYQEESPSYAFRIQPDAYGELVIVSGLDHRTGEESNTFHYYQAISEFVRKHFNVKNIEYAWSTQDSVTLDGVPYIGRYTRDSKYLYVATGYAKWGMTSATAAAMIISDLIAGSSNAWTEVFDPSRFKPTASAEQMISHLVSGVGGFVLRRMKSQSHKEVEEFNSDEGAVTSINLKNVAVYKDEIGQITKLNPTCTHMKCIVSWNDAERSWDCPCHGSRFDSSGKVIQGPATMDLEQIDD
jgi:glycine/D-amino acid oxidase-like deaminating enzyme/nitrite reductase/ring-hydroxylating ferredoxin subunit